MPKQQTLEERYNYLNNKGHVYLNMTEAERTEFTEIGLKLSSQGYFNQNQETFSLKKESCRIGNNPFMD